MAKPKIKRPGKVLKVIAGKKGKWEIYKTTVKGKTVFGNRLIARNGNLICSNQGFNKPAGAIKNVNAVRASA